MQKIEANQRRMFIGMEIGRGMHKNDVLIIMNKDCKDKGCDWIRENYGVTFKFQLEKTHESTMHVITEKCMETAKEVETHMINELKKKDRENVWFKDSDNESQIIFENSYERKISR